MSERKPVTDTDLAWMLVSLVVSIFGSTFMILTSLERIESAIRETRYVPALRGEIKVVP